MDLHEFGHLTRDKVRAFEKYYRDGHKDAPEDFPLDMPQADWLEQLYLYLED